MDKIKQQIAIAKVCGYESIQFGGTKGNGPECSLHPRLLIGTRTQEGSAVRKFSYIPDYLNDLNAMHEAEKAAFGGNIMAWSSYGDEVVNIFLKIGGQWRPTLTATAAQRAEAFLKTLKLWEES